MIIVMMMADAALFFNQDLQPSTASVWSINNYIVSVDNVETMTMLTMLTKMETMQFLCWRQPKPQWLMMTYLRGVLLLLTQRWREERWPGLATRSVLIIMVTHLHLIVIFIVLVVFFMDISSGIRRVGCGRLWRGGSEGNRRPLEQDWGIWFLLMSSTPVIFTSHTFQNAFRCEVKARFLCHFYPSILTTAPPGTK